MSHSECFIKYNVESKEDDISVVLVFLKKTFYLVRQGLNNVKNRPLVRVFDTLKKAEYSGFGR